MRDEFISKIGVYGQMHYRYLKETKPSVLGVMRMKGMLRQYLEEVNTDAEEMLARLETGEDSVFVIGGEQIYRMLLPQCDECLVTFIDREYDADAFFPDLDADPEWEMTEESEEQTCFDVVYTFRTYRRKA